MCKYTNKGHGGGTVRAAATPSFALNRIRSNIRYMNNKEFKTINEDIVYINPTPTLMAFTGLMDPHPSQQQQSDNHNRK